MTPPTATFGLVEIAAKTHKPHPKMGLVVSGAAGGYMSLEQRRRYFGH